MYLYGVPAKEFNKLYYLDALAQKIKCGKKLLRTLVRTDNMVDSVRINKVYDAIEFNKELLKEI